uniref:Uncharacterized protein n=1 Tax=Daphnia magna TaxID=35525 RepID=A0A0P6BTY0_9CRUS
MKPFKANCLYRSCLKHHGVKTKIFLLNLGLLVVVFSALVGSTNFRSPSHGLLSYSYRLSSMLSRSLSAIHQRRIP